MKPANVQNYLLHGGNDVDFTEVRPIFNKRHKKQQSIKKEKFPLITVGNRINLVRKVCSLAKISH